MLKATLDFASLLSSALLAGAMVGVWLGFNPTGLGASAYVTIQQQAIRRLNRPMPLLGALTVLLTLAAAGSAFDASQRTPFLLLIAAAVCFVAAGLITRLLNQPINALVITWSADAPPGNWAALRDRWWRSHQLRTVAGLAGLGLAIAAALTA